MQKVYVRNRFRIRNLMTNTIERLNSVMSVNGTWLMVAGFDTYAEAEAMLKTYCPDETLRKKAYDIETYPSHFRSTINQPTGEAAKVLEQARVFSGEGLKYNSSIPKRDENKYSSSRYYDRDTWFAQSAERSKGLSVHKNKHAKPKFDDLKLFEERINKLPNTATITLGFCIVDAIRSKLHQFPNRKSLRDYLKDKGYGTRHSNRIISQVYDKTI